jgi:Protein of unknown function (DUF2917)
MIVNTTATCLSLLPGQVTRLQLRAGTRVRGLRGTAWLTADGVATDILLDPQDEWVADRDRRLLACALHADGRAMLQLDEPPARPR